MAKSAYSCGGSSVAFNVTTSPVCAGVAVNFANNSTGTNPNIFIWRWGDGQITTTGNNTSQTHIYAAAGNYTVWLVGVFINPNCRDSISLNVPVGATPNPAFSFTNNSCSNTPVQFNNTTTGNGNSYLWSFGGVGNSTLVSPAYQFNAYGLPGTQSFPVSLTVTNAAGCSATLTQNVTVQNRPQGALTGFGTTDCSFSALNPTPSAISVSNISSFNTSVNNYQINWGDGSANYSASTLTNTSHTYNLPGSYNILLTLTTPNGCNDTTIYSYYYGSNPSVGLGNPGGTNGCAPVAFSFPINLVLAAANTPGTTYEFLINDGSNPITYTQSSLPSSISHLFTSSSCGISSQGNNNSFQAQLRAINPCDVSSATISPIKISEKAEANFSINPAPVACVNQVVTFQNTSLPASSVGSSVCDSTVHISWTITPAIGWTVSTGALGQFPVIFNNSTYWGSSTLGIIFNQAGTYQISMSASGLNCGVDTLTQSICIINPPIPAFTLSNNLGCIPFNCSTTNNTAAPPCGNNTYNWVVTYAASSSCDNTASFNFTGGTNAASQNPSFIFNNAGNYTITLNVINPCGTFSTSQVVTVNRPPQVTVNPVLGICAGANISPSAIINNCGSAITNYNWTFPSGNPSSSNLQVPPSISYATPGNFLISLSVSNICGSASNSQTINVSPFPVVSVNPSNTTICTGQSANISASGAATYSWSPATNLNTTTGSNVIANPTSSTVYTVIGTSSIGCTSAATATVNVIPTPILNVVSNPPTICVGQSSTLTASGANTYVWSPSSTLNSPTGASVIAIPLSSTSYTVTGTAVNGCTSTANVTVNVNPLPIVNAGSDLSFCNQNIQQTLTGYTPLGGTWTGSGVTSAGIFTPSVAGNGTFTLTYTYTDGNGCANTDNIQVNVSSPTTVNAGNGFSICFNSSPVTLTGATPISGAWSGVGIAGSMFNPSIAGIGMHILTFSAGAGSCLISDTIQVVVLPNPTVSATSIPTTICVGQSTTLTASGANTYVWTPSSTLNSSTGASVIATPLSSSSYNVTGTATNGCTSSANVSINVNPLPTVNAGSDLSFCNQNIPQTLTGYNPLGGTWTGSGVTSAGIFTPSVAGNGTFTLTYTFTDGNGCANTDNIQVNVSSPTTVNAGNGFSICFNSSPVTLTGATPISGAWSGVGIAGSMFNPSIAGIGMHILTFSAGAGSCLISDTIQVVVLPNPTVNATSIPTTICVGQSSTLTASGANTYVWSPSATLNSSSGASVIATPLSSSSYNVTGTASNGCTSSANVSIIVNLLPTVNAGSDLSFCNQNIPQTLTGYTPLGGTWTGSGVTSAGIFTPSVAGNGTFTLTYTFTDGNGCANQDDIQITVSSPTTVNAGNGFSICLNSSIVTLTGATPVSGTWSGVGIAGSIFNPSIAGVGTHILTYTTGSGSCLVSDTIQVVVNPIPNVDITSPQSTICIGDSVQLNGLGALVYNWYGQNGLLLASGPIVTLIPVNTGYIFVDATDANTCSGADSIMIQVNPLPNVSAGLDQTYCNQNIPESLAGFSPSGGIWSGIGVNPTPVNSPTFNPGLAGVGSFNLLYTYTDGNGCINSDTMIASIQNPLQANAGMNQSICFSNNSVQLNGNSPLGYWNGIIVDSTGLFTPDTTGMFNMIFSVGAGSCLTQDTLIVIVNPLPLVAIGPDLNFCISDLPATLQSNISGGLWSGLGITNQTTGIFDPSLITPGTSSQLLYEFQSSLTGCVNYDTLIAYVHPLPVVSFTTVSIACINAPVQFINNTAGNNSYNWDFGDSNTSATQQPTHTYIFADTVNVSLIVTSNEGCLDSLIQPLIIAEPPSASFIDNQVSSCGQQLITFTNTSISQYSTYSWDFDNGVTSTDINPLPVTFDIGNSVDTSFVVLLTASNLCGIDTFQDTINLFSFPLPNFAFYPQTVCSGVPVSFSNISFGYDLSYEWFVNGSLISTANNPLPYTFTANLTDSVYIVTLSASNICDTVSISVPITVHPADVYPFFTVDSSFACMGQTIYFNSAVPSYNYIIWRYGDGPNSIDTLPYHTYSNPGTYTVWQVVYGFCGIDSISRPVTIFPNPQPLFSFSNPICSRDSAIFNNLSPGNNNFYYWNFGDGEYSSVFSPGHLYNLPSNNTTTFNVTLTVTSASTMCKDSLTLPITVLHNPVADFSIIDNEVCLGSPISLNAATAIGLNYEWAFSDGTIILGSQVNQTFQDTGTYSFILRVNDSNQCWDDTSFNMIYIRPNAISNFNYNQLPPCAPSVEITFTNLSSQSNNYLWNFNGQGTSNLQTPIPLNFSTPTSFTATLIANNSYNCPDTSNQQIEVVIKPIAVIVAPDRVCEGEEFSLTNNSIFTGSVTWSLNGSTIGNLASYVLSHDIPGIIDIGIIAFSAFDSTCFDTASTSIIVDEAPIATFTVNPIDTMINGMAISPCAGYFSLIPEYKVTDKLFWWDFGNGSSSTSIKPNVFYDNNGQYLVSLLVENIYGCKNNSTQIIDVFCDGLLVLPNALSPSSDDPEIARFIPKGKNIETLRIEIFSPWGERVWFTDKIDQEGRPTDFWDGKYRDKDLPQGSYLVKARATFSSKLPFDKLFYLTLLR